MASFNKVILMGNLTRDPQLSYLPSGTAVCEFGLAVSHKWRDREGQMKEETCFVDCNLYAKSAETFNQYMSKGKPVLIEGRLRYETWQTPEGQTRSKHRVFVENFRFVGGRQDGQGGAVQTGAARAAPAPSGRGPAPAARGSYDAGGDPGYQPVDFDPSDMPSANPEDPPF